MVNESNSGSTRIDRVVSDGKGTARVVLDCGMDLTGVLSIAYEIAAGEPPVMVVRMRASALDVADPLVYQSLQCIRY